MSDADGGLTAEVSKPGNCSRDVVVVVVVIPYAVCVGTYLSIHC